MNFLKGLKIFTVVTLISVISIGCINDPVSSIATPVDQSNNKTGWVETAFDVGCFAVSLSFYNTNPGFLTGAAVILDGAAVMFPFIPAVAGVSIRAIEASHILEQGFKYGIKPYNKLKRLTAGTGLQDHHIMPKTFAKYFGIINTDDMFSIAIDYTTHGTITKRMSTAFGGYRNMDGMTGEIIKGKVKDVYLELYKESGEKVFEFLANFIEKGQYIPK